jgi:hypothetical protein
LQEWASGFHWSACGSDTLFACYLLVDSLLGLFKMLKIGNKFGMRPFLYTFFAVRCVTAIVVLFARRHHAWWARRRQPLLLIARALISIGFFLTVCGSRIEAEISPLEPPLAPIRKLRELYRVRDCCLAAAHLYIDRPLTSVLVF